MIAQGDAVTCCDEATDSNQPPSTSRQQPVAVPPFDEAAVLADEAARVDARRDHFRIDAKAATVGLALSGGGIRSATICLGVLRSMARRDLLHRVDYLSTVSGGGYAGAFLGSLYARTNAADRPVDDDAAWARALHYLRQGGRYLVPSGTQDAAHSLAIAIRNWIAVHVVIGVSVVAVVLVLNALRALLWTRSDLAGVEAGWLAPAGVPGLLWPTTWIDGRGVRDWGLSWLWPLVLAPLSVAVAAGWAYWLPSRTRIWRARLLRIVTFQAAGIVGFAALGILLLASDCARAGPWNAACSLASAFPGATAVLAVISALAVIALVMFIGIETYDAWRERRAPLQAEKRLESDARLVQQEDRVRMRLSRLSGLWLLVAVVVAGAALIDTVGNYIYEFFRTQTPIAAVGVPAATTAVVVAALRKLLDLLPRSWKVPPVGASWRDFLRRWSRTVALVAGLALVILLFGVWAAVAHILSWRLEPLGSLAGWGMAPAAAAARIAGLAAAAAALAILIGQCMAFLNLSSFAAFYASRLRRAYLGASNPARTGAGAAATAPAPDHDHPDDDLTLGAYYLSRAVPVHLINVTINETTNRRTRLIQRDRKGKPLVVSPGGYLASGASMAEPMLALPLGTGEQLPLSSWVGISGAAFSTGVGQNGSLGQALIAGLANVRLGYWWAPAVSGLELRRPALGDIGALARALVRVQRYLLAEFRASFAGTEDQRWYLTDGGHFENSGAYALLRRRVATIIVCDSGADPGYDYDDLVNLVRKARIDLGTRVDFLDAAELTGVLGDGPLRPMFGTLDELARKEATGAPGPYAALAAVDYPASGDRGGFTGALVVLKPRLTGAEARDVLRYSRLNGAFPQQSTLDQFFDEAQWESYYELGRRMGEAVLAPAQAGSDGKIHWAPSDLKPFVWPVAPKPVVGAPAAFPAAVPAGS